MAYTRAIAVSVLAAALTTAACNRNEPGEERETAATGSADTSLNERSEDAAELDNRVAEIERQWSQMQAEVKEENRTPTAGLREEVKEDVANARDAVANLKTTTQENWWERHEKATERTLADIEADVQRFAKTKPAATPEPQPAPVGTVGFEERRDAWVARARARIDAMEERLEGVDVEGASETELQDTRARIDKLQDDLDRLRTVSAEEWWDVSAARVREYIDRVERSIGRLDNDTADKG